MYLLGKDTLSKVLDRRKTVGALTWPRIEEISNLLELHGSSVKAVIKVAEAFPVAGVRGGFIIPTTGKFFRLANWILRPPWSGRLLGAWSARTL